MQTKTLLVILFMFFSNAFSQTSRIVYEAAPVTMPGSELRQLLRSGKINDIYLDSANEVALLTNKILWKWNIEKNQLEQASLISPESNLNLESIIFNEPFYYLTTQESIIKINRQSFEATDFSNNLFTTTSGKKRTLPWSDGIIWWHQSSPKLNYLPKDSNNSHPTFFEAVNLNQSILSVTDDQNNIWFVNTQNELWLTNSKDSSSQKIAALETPAHTLTTDGKFVAANLNDYVLIFNASHPNSHRKISARPKNSIKEVFLTPTEHLYLFADGSVEAYHIKSKQTFRHQLNLDRISSVEKVLYSQGTLAALNEGKIYVYKLKTPL